MTASPAVASPGSGSSMMRIGSGAPSAESGSYKLQHKVDVDYEKGIAPL